MRQQSGSGSSALQEVHHDELGERRFGDSEMYGPRDLLEFCSRDQKANEAAEPYAGIIKLFLGDAAFLSDAQEAHGRRGG